jgi:hypothetical protein
MLDIKIVKHNLPSLYSEQAIYLEKIIGKAYSSIYEFTYSNEKNAIEKVFKQYEDSNFLFTLLHQDEVVAFVIGRYLDEIGEYQKVLCINEISVLPKFRGLKLSEKLRDMCVKDFNPNIIFGESNNPISVKSRESASRKMGYYTYWMEETISDINPLSFEKVQKISYKLAEYFDPENIGKYKDGCMPFTIDSDAFPEEKYNTIPELSKLFDKIKLYSNTVSKSALGVLISIKSGYEKYLP